LSALAALENGSEHPLARAIVDWATSRDLLPLAATDFARVEGEGVTGVVGGEPWFAGTRRLAVRCQAELPLDLETRARSAEEVGQTAVFFGASGAVHGLLILGDALRPGAAEAACRLRQLGIAVEVISGDTEAATRAFAGAAGIDRISAEMRPADKVARVKDAQISGAAGRILVAAVGDGINDAPALAQADVGIAFGTGTEIARRAADVTLVGDNLVRLADLFVIAGRTATVMKQNLFWACLYNAICIPLAVAGLVNPIVAAGAMLVSSLTVVRNTKRLRRNV
jgi:Cu+-exporting ATPase